MDEIRAKTADIPGIKVEVTAPDAGPPTGKPIQVQLTSHNPEALRQAAIEVADRLAKRPEIRDLDNGLPMPGIDWRLEIDKAEAAKYGIGVGGVGAAVQSRHQRAQDHRLPPAVERQAGRHHRPRPGGPADAEPDRRPARPDRRRAACRSATSSSACRASRTGIINRIDGKRVITVTANLAEGVQTAAITQAVASGTGKRRISAARCSGS